MKWSVLEQIGACWDMPYWFT